MADTDLYIDKAPKKAAEEPDVPKPLRGRWWKYGLVFALLQVGLWLIVGFRINPNFSFGLAFRMGGFIYGTFIIFGFLPFVLGRLGLTRMMWFMLVGVLMGLVAYHLLASFEPARRFNLLPFISYLQLAFAGVSLGLLWELGRWVFRKLKA